MTKLAIVATVLVALYAGLRAVVAAEYPDHGDWWIR